MKIISNASPLISLAAVERLDVLQKLFNQISIPTTVYDEIMVHGKSKPGARAIDRADWITRKKVKSKRLVQNLRKNFHLGTGEAATIALAIQEKANWVLVDELRGRQVAAEKNLKVIGTIGCLLLAKKLGLIENVTSILDELMDAGFRLSQMTYEQTVIRAGEINK